MAQRDRTARAHRGQAQQLAPGAQHDVLVGHAAHQRRKERAPARRNADRTVTQAELAPLPRQRHLRVPAPRAGGVHAARRVGERGAQQAPVRRGTAAVVGRGAQRCREALMHAHAVRWTHARRSWQQELRAARERKGGGGELNCRLHFGMPVRYYFACLRSSQSATPLPAPRAAASHTETQLEAELGADDETRARTDDRVSATLKAALRAAARLRSVQMRRTLM
jgi:hypothetical protein